MSAKSTEESKDDQQSDKQIARRSVEAEDAGGVGCVRQRTDRNTRLHRSLLPATQVNRRL